MQKKNVSKTPRGFYLVFTQRDLYYTYVHFIWSVLMII